MASDNFHEPLDLLSQPTREMHRGIVSLIEELEAIDWYQQRADACGDAELKEVLLHNMREEVEHAAMTLEWLRRGYEIFARQISLHLFTTGPIVPPHEDEVSAAAVRGAEGAADPDRTLGIGSLRGR